VPRVPRDAGQNRWIPASLLLLAASILVGLAGGAGPRPGSTARPPAMPSAAPKVRETAPPAAAAPVGLPVIDYWTSPRGFPADPAPRSTAALTVGLRATTRLVLYDSPGGRPRAFLPRSISGVPVVVPLVARSTGWVAVLLPSVNRRMGWLPATGWVPRALRDQLVLRRRTHELTWLRDGIRRGSWTVSVGAPATPTPLGRTFVLGRTTPGGAVYAGLDALALGSVPDDRHSVSAGLRGAHTGIHSWYRTDAFGRNASNGCIRVPPTGQRTLLKNIAPGTTLIVVD
jgi:L,D-transpeptidase catalytic domain